MVHLVQCNVKLGANGLDTHSSCSIPEGGGGGFSDVQFLY